MKRLKFSRVKHILTGFIAVALIAGSIGIATAEGFYCGTQFSMLERLAFSNWGVEHH